MENPNVFEREFDKKSVSKTDASEIYAKEMKEVNKLVRRKSRTIKVKVRGGTAKEIVENIRELETELAKNPPTLVPLESKEYRKSWTFKNDYGISVVRGFGTYGGDSGLFEIAVITSDVIGYLKAKEVLKIGKKIIELVKPK